MNLDKKFVIGSFLFHIAVIVLLSTLSTNNNLRRSFIVFGAHSKKPTHAYFKPLRIPKKQGLMLNNKSSMQSKERASQVNINQKKKRETSKITSKNILKQKKKQLPKKNAKKKIKHVKKSQPKKIMKKGKGVVKKEKKLAKIKNKQEKKAAQIKKVEKKKENVDLKSKIKEQKKNREIIKKEKDKQNSHKKIKGEEKTFDKDNIKSNKADTKNNVGAKNDDIKSEVEEIPEEPLTFDLIASSDPKIYEYQRSIQRTVASIWRPPVGVSKGTEATVSFVVDHNGRVTSFEILDEPRNLLYKLSIIKVAKRFVFEKCLWGKEFNIVFRQ